MELYISIIHNRKKTNSVRVVTMGLTKVIDILVWENWKKYKYLTKKEKSSAPPFASNSNISIKSLSSQKHRKTGSENLKPIRSYYSTPKIVQNSEKNQSWYESPTVLHAVPHYGKTIHEKTILVELLWNSSYREVKIYEMDCIIYKYIYILYIRVMKLTEQFLQAFLNQFDVFLGRKCFLWWWRKKCW